MPSGCTVSFLGRSTHSRKKVYISRCRTLGPKRIIIIIIVIVGLPGAAAAAAAVVVVVVAMATTTTRQTGAKRGVSGGGGPRPLSMRAWLLLLSHPLASFRSILLLFCLCSTV